MRYRSGILIPYFSSKLFIILTFKPAQYCVDTLWTAEIGLIHRGMDFIRCPAVSGPNIFTADAFPKVL